MSDGSGMAHPIDLIAQDPPTGGDGDRVERTETPRRVPEQLGFFEAAPVKRRRLTLRPASERPRTFGECVALEHDRRAELERRWLPVVPAPCLHRCRHNLLTDFPRATGDTCVLRLSVIAHSTEEIAERLGVSEALVKKIIVGAAGKVRERSEPPDVRGSHHSPEYRIARILADGPACWREIADDLGIEGGELDRIAELLRGMVRRGQVTSTEVDGVMVYQLTEVAG